MKAINRGLRRKGCYSFCVGRGERTHAPVTPRVKEGGEIMGAYLTRDIFCGKDVFYSIDLRHFSISRLSINRLLN